MEQTIITGVAVDDTEAKLTVHGVPDQPGVAAKLFGALAADGISVDMIVQNVSTGGHTDISFTVPQSAMALALAAAEKVVPELAAGGVDASQDIAKVSLVGAGIKNEPGVAADMFRVLASASINIEMISTSPIRISCVIERARAEEAVNLLHDHFIPAGVGS